MLETLGRIQKESEKHKKTSRIFGRKVRNYTKEFRKEVVMYSDGHSLKQTASHFSIPQGTISTWRSKERKNKLRGIPTRSNHPDSKPHGPRIDTTPMPENPLPNRSLATANMTTAEQELVELSEKLWKELSTVDDAIKLLRLYKNKT